MSPSPPENVKANASHYSVSSAGSDHSAPAHVHAKPSSRRTRAHDGALFIRSITSGKKKMTNMRPGVTWEKPDRFPSPVVKPGKTETVRQWASESMRHLEEHAYNGRSYSYVSLGRSDVDEPAPPLQDHAMACGHLDASLLSVGSHSQVRWRDVAHALRGAPRVPGSRAAFKNSFFF